MAAPAAIQRMREDFLKLDAQVKKFGKMHCKHHRRRTKPKAHPVNDACCHPAMAFGGMSRNTNCELENCPRVLYGDEPGKTVYKHWGIRKPTNGGI